MKLGEAGITAEVPARSGGDATPAAPEPAPLCPAGEATGRERAWTMARGTARRVVASGPGRAALGATLALLLFVAGTGYRYQPARPAPPLAELLAEARGAGDRATARAAVEALRVDARLRAQVPRGAYVVIDQTHNRIRLMRGQRLELEAPCSAGSGLVLRESAGNRVWVFDTPRGAFSVLSRIERPVWKKPDWAFVEEGEPIPSDPAERFEYGVLGEYALYFGHGYMIHGTLYERLIGRPVSHGCIRVGRDPLRHIYRAMPLGARVFIY